MNKNPETYIKKYLSDLNHKFIYLNEQKVSSVFICKKCNIFLFIKIHDHDFYFTKKFKNIEYVIYLEKYISCNEYIIKKIIE